MENTNNKELEIKVGDKVFIKEAGRCYSSYTDFIFNIYKNSIPDSAKRNYRYGQSFTHEANYTDYVYTVVFIGRHPELSDNIAVVVNEGLEETWLIGIGGDEGGCGLERCMDLPKLLKTETDLIDFIQQDADPRLREQLLHSLNYADTEQMAEFAAKAFPQPETPPQKITIEGIASMLAGCEDSDSVAENLCNLFIAINKHTNFDMDDIKNYITNNSEYFSDVVDTSSIDAEWVDDNMSSSDVDEIVANWMSRTSNDDIIEMIKDNA